MNYSELEPRIVVFTLIANEMAVNQEMLTDLSFNCLSKAGIAFNLKDIAGQCPE